MNHLSIQHVSFSRSGGAGQVAKNLNDGLIGIGHDSTLKTLTSGNIQSLAFRNPKIFLNASIDFFIVRKSLSQSLFSLYRNGSSLSATDIHRQIVHLHWTPGMVSYSDIRTFSNLKLPVVWTLHDMFPFTGGCHHAMNCAGYQTNCSNCPQVRLPFQKRVSRSLMDKIETIRTTQTISIVTPSVWLGNKAKESQVFRNTSVSVIPNPINTDVFTPKLGKVLLSERRLIVGCNATNLLDPMKGVLTILRVLETFQIGHPELDVELVAIGGGQLPNSRIKIRQSGYISDEAKVIELYQDMDVFISMSLAEAFPLSIAEAQSCGIPVICLKSGGMPEMIDHGVTGYVVDSPEDLLNKLSHFSDLGGRVFDMGTKSRAKAKTLYSTNVVVNKYVDVYTQALAK